VDWQTWHDAYDLPDSALWRRLRTVQARVRAALDTAPLGPLRVISVCAGQGRDLLDVLDEHPRRDDVAARLVVWTRHRRPPDQVPRICQLLREQGFERQWISDPREGWGVGAHRFTGEPRPLVSRRRMFTFVGSDALTRPGRGRPR
jgi:hypothetical protein